MVSADQRYFDYYIMALLFWGIALSVKLRVDYYNTGSFRVIG